MEVESLKAPYARTGGKYFTKKYITPFINENIKNIETYVEPFFGAGSIFFGKTIKHKNEIINDYDFVIYSIMKGLKETGKELNSIKEYFNDKSVLKWYICKEKNDRRERMNKSHYKGNPKYLSEIYSNYNSNNSYEELKEMLFMYKNNLRFPDERMRPNKLAMSLCNCLTSKSNEIKIETGTSNIVVKLIRNYNEETNEWSYSFSKNTYYMRNKSLKKDGTEKEWKIHNVNLCGWKDTFDLCEKYQNRLNQVSIYNEDYKTLINKYDSEKTLFYFDPPWSKNSFGQSGKKCYSNFVNPIDIYNNVKDIKGKWLMSYNNDEYNLELFKDFKVEKINAIYTTRTKNSKNVIDILIFSNNFFNN